jgi:outer membrane lipoprotein-sorting protein
LRAPVTRPFRALRALALAAAFAPAALDAAPGDLDRIMQSLASRGAGTVRFTESKSVALLKQPIESSGTLSYRPPAYLEKRTVAPRAERLVVDGERLTVERGTERLELRLGDYPGVRAFIDGLRGTLAGDLGALRRHYRVELQGDFAAWQLYLLPSDPQMAELVTQVRVTGGEARIDRVEILEASGDRSVMTLSQGAR